MSATTDLGPEAMELRRADFVLSASASPPAALDRAESVELPDRWRETRPGSGGSAWYRLRVPGPAPQSAKLAVYLPSFNMNAGVWVNGSWVGDGGRFEEPVAHGFNRPLLFALPGTLLDRAENHVDVRLFAYAGNYGELGPVWVGPADLLRAQYEERLFWRADLARWCSAIAGLGALFIGTLWVGTRFRPEYGLFAVALSLWTAVSLNYWVRDIPFSHFVWERFIHGSLVCFVAVIPLWAHRFLEVARPRLDRAFLAYGGASLLALVAVPDDRFYDAAGVLHSAGVGVAGYLVYLALTQARKLQPVERRVCIAGAAGALLLGAHDLLIQLDLLDPDRPRLLVATATLMLLSFGTALVMRFLRAFAAVEDRNLELERERAVSRERERIMREVHDGAGASLVSTLAMVEGGESRPSVVAAIRAALEDMRLVLDSVDPTIRDLNAVLAQFRARFDPVIDRNDLRFEWHADELPRPEAFGAPEYLQVLRIAQEAVANALRHAGARCIRMSASRERRDDRDGVRIAIEDDGVGIPENPRAGRGLRNMKARAHELGGSLSVSRAEPGTVVSLWLPLTRPGG